MNNVVTFETALRLKEAGFPQPEPKAGQLWRERNGVFGMFFISRVYKKKIDGCFIGGNSFVCYGIANSDVFVPTATDILEQLPGYNLAFATENGWHCFFLGIDGAIYAEHNHKDSAAEAAALAWLHLNEK